MWCTNYGIFMLCVVNIMTIIVVNVDLRMHDKLLKK
jgi:hypothetical protein